MAHESRVKVRLTLQDGTTVDRVPAWSRLARAPQGQMGAKFYGVHWSPPEHERHHWSLPHPASTSLRRTHTSFV